MVAGLVACGDDDASTTASTAPPPAKAEQSPRGGGDSQGQQGQGGGPRGQDGSGEQPGSGKSSSSGGEGSGDEGGSGGSDGSVGAAAEFVRPGKDNSIPTFGEEARSAEEKEVETVLTRYLDARAAGDWKTVCSYLGGDATAKLDLVERATGGKIEGCSGVVEAIAGKSSPESRKSLLVAGIAALRIEGLEAFALFHGPEGTDYVMPLFREDGAWKVTELAPIPYPLGSAQPTP